VTKRLLVLLATLAVAAGLASPALAQDTASVAVNTKDGSSIFRLAFAIKRAGGDVVDNVNAAVAFSSCTDCQTVAISIQVVLITGDAETVTPQNIAIAINENCTLCDTLASAYQFVLTTDGQVHFSAEGNREIAEIRRELQELRKSDLSGPEIQERLTGLMQRLAVVLRNELVAAGHSGQPPPQASTATATTEETPTEPAPTTETPTTSTETTPPESTPTEPAETTTPP
jgi:putative peptide zinc metalloprotease protein